MNITTRALAIALAGLSAGFLSRVEPASAQLATVKSDQPNPRVTANFDQAPISRVLEWLSKQDANFVVASDSLPKDLKLTIHVQNEPLSSVEKVIAHAMGGSWKREDGILVFAKGSRMMFMTEDDGPRVIQDMLSAPGFDDASGIKLRDEMMKSFGPDFKLKLDKEMGPEFQMKIEKEFGPDFQKKIEKEFGPEFQLKIEKEFGPDFQKKIQDQFGPDFQKKIEEQVRQAQEMAKKAQAEAGRQRIEEDKEIRIVHGSSDLGALLESLTDDQRAKMKSKGYLTPGDLNSHQKQLLGDVNGTFELDYSSDKGSLKIKSS